MNDFLISIIVPVFNSEKYLDRCILSVLTQTYGNFELIFVDDGSTDDSSKIINKYRLRDARIKYYYQRNNGAAIARNSGMDRASGKYIFFLDADDFLEKDIIYQMSRVAEQKHSDLVICGYRTVEDRNKEIVVIREVVPKQYQQFSHEEWAYRICATCCRLYSMDLLKKYHIRFTSEKKINGEDIPFSMSANLFANNICVIQEIGYNYLQRKDSAMHTFCGLHDRDLPYQAMNEMLKLADSEKAVNSIEFFRFGVLKFLAQCKYQLANNATKEKRKILTDYISYIIKEHKKVYLNAIIYVIKQKAQYPISIYAAVILLLSTI